jgi:LPS-assembly protein
MTRLLPVLLLLLTGSALAAPDAVPRLCPAPLAEPLALPTGDPDDQTVHVDAGQTEREADGDTVLTGGVTAVQGDRVLHTDRLEYSPGRQRLSATGGVQFRDPRISVEAERADVDMATKAGAFEAARFRLPERGARGAAERLERRADGESRLLDVSFTSCPEGQDDWLLSGARFELDHASGVGTGHEVWLRFQGVPLFYTPWITFPIDDRRMTGLLPPEIGTSDRSGTEYVQPFYWNIAPAQDATFTFHPTSKRGVLLENEYRYLTSTRRGSVEFDALPDDRLRDDARGRLHLRDSGSFGAGWRTELDAETVSDTFWFEDLGNSLTATTQTHLEQRFDVLRSGIDYAFRTRLQGYQITDSTLASFDHPYDKLPELTLNLVDRDGPLGLHYEFGGELVNFHHDERVRGLRLDFAPHAWLPLRGEGWFLTPSATLRHTQYALTNDPTVPASISRTLPTFSIDGGLLFERDVAWQGGLLQTLEPRFYYLYVPYRDQTQIPLFDTTIPDVSLYQLFRDNRFIGADRVGDANQVSAAVTSRLIDPATGRVLLTGSVGQITYFNDRRVTLAGPADTAARSELIAELGTDPTRAVSLTAAMVYDPTRKVTGRSALQLRWRPEERKALNLSYRFRDGSVEQTDLGFAWPVAPRWRVVGRWNYSLRDAESLETFGGIEYESCCWSLRLVSRRYIYNRAGDFDRTLFLQLELKGLASIGKSTDELLRRGIPGYGTRTDY